MDDSDSVWDSSDQEEVTYERTMAEKEWNRLHQNHGNEGYKEGIIEGKEVWMQRGFDSGYEEGLAVGKALGHLRGRVSTYVLFYTVMLEQPVTALQELLEELSQVQVQHVFTKEHFDPDTPSDALTPAVLIAQWERRVKDALASVSQEENGAVGITTE